MSGSPHSRTDSQLSEPTRVLGTNAAVDDTALVERALAGETDAFDRLVQRYQRVLYTIALKVTQNPEDARDVTQTTFLRAWQSLESFDRHRRFFSWLYRIALNLSLSLRSRRRDTTEIPDSLRTEQPSPIDRLEGEEKRERIHRAVDGLPAHYREVILLRHMAELSYREIAEALDLPEKTVKSRLFTARRRLAEQLAAEEREA